MARKNRAANLAPNFLAQKWRKLDLSLAPKHRSKRKKP
jgi:hypothetical protein